MTGRNRGDVADAEDICSSPFMASMNKTSNLAVIEKEWRDGHLGSKIILLQAEIYGKFTFLLTKYDIS